MKTNKQTAHGPFRPINQEVIENQLNQSLSVDNDTYLKGFMDHYCQKNKKSKEHTIQYRPVYADQRAVSFFHLKIKELCFPIVYQEGKGAYVWDIDGNKYIDIAMDFGANLFGHQAPFLRDALIEQANKGWGIGMRPEKSAEAATMLCQLTGHDRAVFAQSGSEAVMTAVRLARQVSGKAKVVIFNHSYHGHSDVVLGASVVEDDKNVTHPITQGTTEGAVEDLIILPYCEELSLEIIRQHIGELAAVLVEPVQSRGLKLNPAPFLKQLRKITEDAGVALIFDEMVTGFRTAQGGVQELFGIRADITTYGKVLGGGIGIGAIAGRKKYLDAIDGGEWNYNDKSYPQTERTFFAGTHSQNTVAVAVIHAVLTHLIKTKGEIQKKVTETCSYMAQQINSFFDSEDIQISVNFFGSLFRFEPKIARNAIEFHLFLYHLRDNGIMVSEIGNNFLSSEHGSEEIEKIIDAVKQSVATMRTGGYFKKNEKPKVTAPVNASILEDILIELD